MQQPTEAEMEKLRKFYRSSSAIRTELEYLRMRWPMLETREEQEANLTDRAVLAKLLLTVDK